MPLSIDDVLPPLPEAPRLGGAGPFVINLSASTMPISPPATDLPGCETLTVYQLQRTEDRRVRYRLRLGPFLVEDEAIAALERVRSVYPTALTATAEADDLRTMATIRAKADSRKAAKKPQPAVDAPAPAAAPTAAAAPRPAAAAPTPTPTPATAALELTLAPYVEAAPKPVVAATPDIAVPELTFAPYVKKPEPVAAPAAATISTPPVLSLEEAVSVPPSKSPRPVLVRNGSTTAPAARAKPTNVGPHAPQSTASPGNFTASRGHAKPTPTFETTQSVRPLTQLERDDAKNGRWFVIELSLSEKPFDPDTVPNLDIYRLYRLYCVAGREKDRVMYALRLGFFGEEVAAIAVANYLAAHYDKPKIKRVSAAERERFAGQQLEARKDVGASGRHAAIEITNERYVR
jgi:hypothetical protein